MILNNTLASTFTHNLSLTPRLAYLEGEGDPSPTPTPTPTPAPTPDPEDRSRWLPPDRVTEIVTQRTSEYAVKMAKAKEQLDAVLSEKATTETEKANLRKKLEELQSTLMTKEQAAAFEAEKLKAEAQTLEQRLTAEAKQWKDRYRNTLITNSLVAAANEHKAYRPEQIVAFLKDRAELVEALDETGKPTGDFQVKLSWSETDKDGKTSPMTLDPSATVKAMKQKVDFANLFLAEGGGTGFVPTRGNQNSGSLDPDKISTEDWVNGNSRERYAKHTGAGQR